MSSIGRPKGSLDTKPRAAHQPKVLTSAELLKQSENYKKLADQAKEREETENKKGTVNKKIISLKESVVQQPATENTILVVTVAVIPLLIA